jgi:hypothetical protein
MPVAEQRACSGQWGEAPRARHARAVAEVIRVG